MSNGAVYIPAWLDDIGRKVYLSILPKLKEPDLEMLAAYANCWANLRRVRNDAEKGRVWREALLFCKNGLFEGPKVFVDILDLLIDSGNVGELEVISHLDSTWQLPESERPGDYFKAPVDYW